MVTTSYRIEFLDFHQPTITTFDMVTPFQSTVEGYLLQIVELGVGVGVGQELIELAPCNTASYDGIEFHSRYMRISSPQDWRRKGPPQSSLFPLWFQSLVYYKSGQSSTSFTHKYGIRLHSARDYIASFVAPTGTSGTETGFFLTQETYGKGVFAGLVKDIESRPNSVNMNIISLNSRFSHWYSGAYLALNICNYWIRPNNVRIVYQHCSCLTSNK